jgi:broad specificity phosphatase PhoE
VSLFYEGTVSTLTLVRHAQASLGAADYDKLSAKGESQSALLGGHLVNAGIVFDAVFIGPRLRHRETAAQVERIYRDAGLHWPTPEQYPGLDEYQGEELIKKALPRLLESDEHLQTLTAAYAESDQSDASNRRKSFQRMFEHVMCRWVRGEIDEPGVEPWRDFMTRISSTAKDIQQRFGTKKKVLAFTSGGVIGASVGLSLDLSPEKAIETSWMVHNASLTEFVFSETRFTLSTFNNLPHLRYPSLITYR